jgi:predicted nucleotide-binding protein (sugar kinase/HSP70/actin superfamily)
MENVVVVTLDSENSYNELGSTFSQKAWWAISVADAMKDVETSLRSCAVDPTTAIAKYDELWQQLIEIAEKDIFKILPTLNKIAKEIARIPLKHKMEDQPKVLIVGEIYVRRDDFAVDELIKLLSRKGIIGKVSGVTEWLYYCDHTRKHELKKKLVLKPVFKRAFAKEFRSLVEWKIEELWKHNVDKKVLKALAPTKLIPHTPHNMEEIMGNANKNFVTEELESEISISSGVSYTAMMHDYSGVINISPFACLIGRVIEGLVSPWARENNFPMMSIEIDGETLPPIIINKLEIFMLNVLRYHGKMDVKDLVENIEVKDNSLDRKIIKA